METLKMTLLAMMLRQAQEAARAEFEAPAFWPTIERQLDRIMRTSGVKNVAWVIERPREDPAGRPVSPELVLLVWVADGIDREELRLLLPGSVGPANAKIPVRISRSSPDA